MADRWDMFAHRPGAKTFRMPEALVALALVLKYGVLVAYGALAIMFKLPSFVAVGGSIFALVWAALIFVCASFALGATLRTWYTGKCNMEKWAIAITVLMFLTYSVVIVVRGILLNNWTAIAVALIPVGLSVFPLIRYFWLMMIAYENETKAHES